jgi:RNA-directed DNA polymerase
MENINSWNDIQWKEIETIVFRLQLRIFKAAANQEFNKVHKLQKLLICSQSAKYLSVCLVTQDKADNNTSKVDKKLIYLPVEKFQLANRLMLNGKSSPIRRIYISKADGSQRPVGILTIEDRAKQMLAYLALCPQWEAQFEASNYEFRPGRSVLDVTEDIFLGIAKKPKWVLETKISKCLDQINHQYLLNKCNTFPEMRKQIRVWLKAGILDGEKYVFPEIEASQGGVILPLLVNILLHGLRDRLDTYINKLVGHSPNNTQALKFVRYTDNIVLIYPDKKVLENLQQVVQKFLEPIGLQLNSTKTRMIHTLKSTDKLSSRFTFLGFDIIQKKKWIRMRTAFTKRESTQTFINLIIPSKEVIKRHKLKIREVIHSYRGVSQERLIQKLNPIIQKWAFAKLTQLSSGTFQDLDQYLFIHLWKWARKRHPKMSKYKLKDKYWHQIGLKNWVFGVKINNEISLSLQFHSKIPIQRHVKVKGLTSPFDGNLIYWLKRTGKSPLILPIKD